MSLSKNLFVYFRYYALSSGGCTACGCNAEGSTSAACNSETGACFCKPNIVLGNLCDTCKPG